MQEEKYYQEIKDRLVDVEVTCRVKDYSKNKVTLENYYEIGKLIIEAQGGESRAKYGNKLIKDFSKKLMIDVDKKYSYRNLMHIRKFYLMFKNEKVNAVRSQLSWTHYRILLCLDDFAEINYYIDLAIKENLSYRKLEERIKLKEYERLPDITKQKLIDDEKVELVELVKNPIIIRNPNNIKIISEKILQKLIMEDIYNFLKQLGSSYMFVGNEYPIKIENRYYRIDLLLYNVEYESYVVIELKMCELNYKDISQVKLYMNYVDKNIKKIEHNKTLGIILCRKDNKLVFEYCSDPRVIAREYILN